MVDERIKKLYGQLVRGERTGDLFKDEIIAMEYDNNASLVFGKDLQCYTEDIDYLLDLTTLVETDTVVDLGCGTGISIERILVRNPRRVIGIDSSEAMLQQARTKLTGRENVEFRLRSAEEIADFIQDADKIISANVFHYFVDPTNVLQAVYRALRDGGKYLFNVRVKVSEEQSSLYFQLMRAVERVLAREMGIKVQLPDLIGIEPKYQREDIKILAEKNKFAIKRYEQRPIVYEENHVRTIIKTFLMAFQQEAEQSISQEKAGNIAREMLKELEITINCSQGFTAGTEAYVCLQKNNV